MGPYPYMNQNYNLTWIFSVDSGFSYLVRLHFCEVTTQVTKSNQRVFDIFLNNQTAQESADVIVWAQVYGLPHSNGVPVHKDFVVIVPDNGEPQQDLWLALHPHTASKPIFYDAILNGLEIFKINDASGNLGGPNPIIPAPPVQDKIDKSLSSKGKSKNNIGLIAGCVILWFCCITLQEEWQEF